MGRFRRAAGGSRPDIPRPEPTKRDEVGVVQPYLSTARGVESPTFLLRRRRQRPGLYAVFEQMFQWLIEQSTPE
jgi:hypothetical protein